MIIKNIKWLPYTLQFKSPIQTSTKKITNRKIYIIQLENDIGDLAYGEAAPLPEFGSENFEDVELSLQSAKHVLTDREFNTSLESLSVILADFSNTPTIQNALEQAMLGLLAKKDKNSISKIFPRFEPQNKIEVNGLVGMSSPGQAVELALVLFESGFKTIKLKGGREIFDDDLLIIKKLRKAAKDKLNIRLDVNGKWSLDEAIKNLKLLKEFNLQYVEQPVINIEDLKICAAEDTAPVAADECLRNNDEANDLIHNSKINYFVLKPSQLGGVIKTLMVIKSAKENSKEVVISSSFESALGFSSLIFLADILKSKFAQGVSTINYFTNDLFNNGAAIENGYLKYPAEYFPACPDLSYLFKK